MVDQYHIKVAVLNIVFSTVLKLHSYAIVAQDTGSSLIQIMVTAIIILGCYWLNTRSKDFENAPFK